MSCLHQTVFTFTPRRPVRRLLTIVWPGQLLETRVSRLGSFRHESSSIWKDLVGPGSAVVLVRRTSKHQASTILRILDSKSRRNASYPSVRHRDESWFRWVENWMRYTRTQGTLDKLIHQSKTDYSSVAESF